MERGILAQPTPVGGDGDDGYELVHAGMLHGFGELVASLGGDAAGLLRQHGIDPAEPAGSGAGATYRQVLTLIEEAAAALDCRDFGLRLARLQGGAGATFGPLGRVMRNSATFGDALGYVSGHNYAHSLAARIWLRPLPAERAVFVGHDILLEGIPKRGQAMEQILLLGHLAAREITGGRARVRRVHFRHQPLSPRAVYRRAFGCEVRFGDSADGVVFSEADLAAPVIERDPLAYSEAIAFIEARFTRHRPPVHAEVRGIVMRRLGTAPCTNEGVAAELGLHPRTLHRRLRAEGTSFQQVKDEVRRDAVLYYLESTDLDLAEVSEKLGFAEQSVLTRRCHRWFAAPPTQVRARVRGG
ncbi:MAG: AraC family transcriptional regulator [Novosphingobium sp.]|nr:AraC family transcriptional regulator [Novosphingobium sp.]